MKSIFDKRSLLSLVVGIMLAAAIAGCGKKSVEYPGGELVGTPTDYSKAENWLNIPKITHEVDTIYIYPTVYADPAEDAPTIVPVENEDMRKAAYGNFMLNEGAYSESTNVFAPYYRQSNLMKVAGLSADEFERFQYNEQRTDVYAALDYYFEHYNEGRPYILAGHSQGSTMIRIVLKDYMEVHPEYYERMVAAYVLGFSITKEDLDTHPYLKFAEGADDTGVVVSWNIEGVGNKGKHNAVVLEGGISINPINWKRDETYAPAEDNLGTYVNNPETGRYEKVDTKADAQVDLERGVVICTTPELPAITARNPQLEAMFGPASYHNGDYSFYFDNIKENVKARCLAYLAEH